MAQASTSRNVHNTDNSHSDWKSWNHDFGQPCLVKLHGLKRPVFRFHPVTELHKVKNRDIDLHDGAAYGFKMLKSSSRLIISTLTQHGFRQVHPNSSDYNIAWSGTHIKSHVYRTLSEYQKINHFPRSFELTRKDRLYVNIQRLQQTKGPRHFSFLPRSFLLPAEFSEFYSSWVRKRTPFIVKPIASSQGKGIYIVTHPEEVPPDQELILSQYITNPLLIDGFKFDLRLYVCVTSYDPLRVYLYEDGLARFATTKYSNEQGYGDCYAHLTNYSINKKATGYVACDDEDVEDYGNKWSMSALLQHLASMDIDTAELLAKIEDLIVKTIIAVEQPVAAACRTYVPHRHNCFELYGFDVLIDDQLKPWLLEVNLSPSLSCDAPLDKKIKSHLIADALNLANVAAFDPPSSRQAMRQPAYSAASKARKTSFSADLADDSIQNNDSFEALARCPADFKAVLRRSLDEHICCQQGGFQRIFPTSSSWQRLRPFLTDTSGNNRLLNQLLFPTRMVVSKPSSDRVPMTKDFRQRCHSYHRLLENRNSSPEAPPRVRSSPSSEGSEDDRPAAAVGWDASHRALLPAWMEAVSSIQVRELMATYLRRIEARLIGERRQDVREERVQDAELQLLEHFLKKQSGRLLFNVFVPMEVSRHTSRARRICLVLLFRRRVAIDNIAGFLKLHNAETERLRQRQYLTQLNSGIEEPQEAPAEPFQLFLDTASEEELEQALTSVRFVKPLSVAASHTATEASTPLDMPARKSRLPLPPSPPPSDSRKTTRQMLSTPSTSTSPSSSSSSPITLHASPLSLRPPLPMQSSKSITHRLPHQNQLKPHANSAAAPFSWTQSSVSAASGPVPRWRQPSSRPSTARNGSDAEPSSLDMAAILDRLEARHSLRMENS
eukprot:TRINITY_DN10724_c0_g1_i6.p1 TRINITY_DN10724_c0_g1~~TRINITY_DN10724_c0_g1_i6.p1  ORF type:complete len:907 (+),score=125.96 TRINITY_DN10724_c0_g1_i6:48-2723(+)